MGIPYPYFLVINHELITPTFMNFAKSDPGFVLLQPYSVKDLEVTDGNVTNVLATNREGDEVQISAHMIIACDGASSTVRE
jgi:2-polyprenyl-6-methoxyphenol hydroxylase-like FAD-dependent oxidoreductase